MPAHPAGASFRAWVTLFIVFAIGLGGDLGSKSWCFETIADRPIVLDRQQLVSNPRHDPIPAGARQPVLPGDLLDLVPVLNPGAVFGIGAHHRWFFIVFTLIAIVGGLVVFARRIPARATWAQVGIALVLAGGVGNLYDRIAIGRVRDFLHTLPNRRLPFEWTWPGTNNPEMFPWVFNIADVLLFVGMFMLLYFVNRQRAAVARTETPAPASTTDD